MVDGLSPVHVWKGCNLFPLAAHILDSAMKGGTLNENISV